MAAPAQYPQSLPGVRKKIAKITAAKTIDEEIKHTNFTRIMFFIVLNTLPIS